MIHKLTFVYNSGCGDVWMAFMRKYGDINTDGFGRLPSGTWPLTKEHMLCLLCDCFSHLKKQKDLYKAFHVDHLRWRKLPHGVTHSISVHCAKQDFPEVIREEAHQLLYMKPKARVRAW